MDVDAYEDDPRIVGSAVARIALLTEPCFPIGLEELADLDVVCDRLAIPDADTHWDGGVLVGREIYVRIVFDIVQLAGALGGDEPQVGTVSALLVGDGARSR